MIHVLFYHQEVDFKINKSRQRCWQHQQLSSLPLHFLPHWVCVCVCVCACVPAWEISLQWPMALYCWVTLPSPHFPLSPYFLVSLVWRKNYWATVLIKSPGHSDPWWVHQWSFRGLPCQPTGQDSTFPTQRAQVQSLVRELDPTCHN